MELIWISTPFSKLHEMYYNRQVKVSDFFGFALFATLFLLIFENIKRFSTVSTMHQQIESPFSETSFIVIHSIDTNAKNRKKIAHKNIALILCEK